MIDLSSCLGIDPKFRGGARGGASRATGRQPKDIHMTKVGLMVAKPVERRQNEHGRNPGGGSVPGHRGGGRHELTMEPPKLGGKQDNRLGFDSPCSHHERSFWILAQAGWEGGQMETYPLLKAREIHSRLPHASPRHVPGERADSP